MNKEEDYNEGDNEFLYGEKDMNYIPSTLTRKSYIRKRRLVFRDRSSLNSL